MTTLARPHVVSKWDIAAASLPERVTVSLTELSGSIKDGLLSFCVAIGLAVLHRLFEEELTEVVGPKGRHDQDRIARRHGRERAQVTLGGRRVAVRKPRARHLAGGEVELELGLCEGSTENKTVCNALLGNLIERGLDPERRRLFVIDGGKAIRASVKSTFGKHAVIARCRAHKRRNVLDHLPDKERPFVGRKLDKAWALTNADQAESELRAIAQHLKVQHPGAAASVLEGLEETLTVSRLGLSPTLLRTCKSTNPIESMISVAETVTRNVKRWRDGQMVLRWTAAGLLEAKKQFRRVNGYRDLHLLRRALEDGEVTARSSVA